MTQPVRDDRRDADADVDLGPLLAELQDTLEDLRSELGGSRARPSPRLRPPTPRELLRFTEQHTIPTLIALLEANVRLLELARGALRLADPSAGSTAASDALSGAARDGADATLARLDDALSELRTALSETDLPDDPAARSLLGEARTLAGEVEDRLGEARDRADAGRRDRRSERTTIPVRDPGADADDERGKGDDRPAVDVDAELDSIREEVRGGERSATGDDAESDGSGSDDADATDDSADADRDPDGTDDRPGN